MGVVVDVKKISPKRSSLFLASYVPHLHEFYAQLYGLSYSLQMPIDYNQLRVYTISLVLGLGLHSWRGHASIPAQCRIK